MRARLAHRLWIAGARPEARRFAAALGAPEDAQLALLKQYVRWAADSHFGRAHGTGRVCSLASFRRRVPIRRYDELRPWIDRIRSGQTRVLGPTVRSFVPSSGSIAARKLVPYTSELLAEFGRALQAWIVDLHTRRGDLARGPAYWSLSPAARVPDLPGSAVPCRFENDSTYLGRLAAPLVSAVLATPDAVRHVDDPESFRYTTLRFLLEQPELRLISIWHPSFLTLLLETMRDRWDDLLLDMAHGSLTPPGALEPSLHDSLARRLKADEDRAGELRRIGPLSPRSIWPRLGLISCWADAHSRPAAEDLRQRSGGVEIQPKGLLATEAAVSVPYGGGWPLAVRSHFFEFIDDKGRVLLTHELQRGGEYEVVVSAGNGLLRYRLGDRIRMDGLVGRTPSVRFVGRADRVSDHCGEKLSDGHVSAVLERVLEPLSDGLVFAMLAPDASNGRPGYTLYMEARVDPAGDLAALLDRELSSNPHYRYCRDLGQLDPPRLFRIIGGAQRAYVEACRRAGQGLGEVKPAALSTVSGWTELFDGAYVQGTAPSGQIPA